MSKNKTIANRLNAKLSTGPKTLKGKQSSSRNALKHGINVPVETDISCMTAVKNLSVILINDGIADNLACDILLSRIYLDRVRGARREFLDAWVGNLMLQLEMPSIISEDFDSQVALLFTFDNYERKARSRLRKKLNGTFNY